MNSFMQAPPGISSIAGQKDESELNLSDIDEQVNELI